MEIHYKAEKRSEDPDQYLQSKEIWTIIKDYVQENFVEEIRKEKAEDYLRLLVGANPGEDSKGFEEYYEDQNYHDEKFLKVHLQFFQAHLLKIDKQNHALMNENKELKAQLSNISSENNFLKLK